MSEAAVELSAGQELVDLPISAIRPGDNDRRRFDDDELWALAVSIGRIGQLAPVTVRPTPGGPTDYQLVAGERRWRALQLEPCTAITTIRCIVDHDMTDTQASSVMLAENTGRVDLGIMEEARAYRKRLDEGWTREEIAADAGVALFRVNWRLDVLDLCPEAQAALDCGVLPAGCALELRRLDPNHQIVALQAWQANPTMGHLPFKRKCIEWAAQAARPDQVGLFALDTDQWITDAKAITAKTHSVPTLRKMIAQLIGALETTADPAATALIEKARAMI